MYMDMHFAFMMYMYMYMYKCMCKHTMYMYLHGNREVCLSLGREVDVDGLLGEGLVPLRWSANLDDVKLWEETQNVQRNKLSRM